MSRFHCLLEGQDIPSPEEDFRAAKRLEQYRLGAGALYIPAGLRWNYLPLAAIRTAEESHRCVTAGKCVAVTERRPVLLLHTASEDFTLPLEKAESLRTLLAALPDGR